ncbi:MAG: sigma-54 dependent transcriptional regulator, partial [Spirochaetes bacterium]|nr:sigma-54 dependent transcriptional regulator [Spirochaetota bacterium]
DYLVKPFDPDVLVNRLKRIVALKHWETQIDKGTTQDFGKMLIGESSSMIKIKKLIAKVADAPSTVLITGESGTGKEVVAKMIHNSSHRCEQPFIAVNIGGVPENLLESELFGHEKGAFTGAVASKVGLFESAGAGTLMLDEIGEMPLHLQVKLLRVLQEKQLTRLGSVQNHPLKARIIAATNRNLEEEVQAGRFREDLFFRINVIRIELPPLRERREDIPLLAGYLLSNYQQIMGKENISFSSDAIEKLKLYSFPGNIRELENILERAVIFTETDEIRAIDLNLPEAQTEYQELQNTFTEKKINIKDMEKDAIIAALTKWDSNRTKAALELGITRRTLLNKIKEYQLNL